MRAVLCKTYGPPESLVVEDVAAPDCGPGQVRIKVHASGVNFPDTLIIQGKYQFKPELPFSPGGEVAGVIDAVGAGVEDVRVGDRVIALTGWGGYAEQVVVEAERVLPLPQSMDLVTGAGFGLTYGTSIHALRQRGQLAAGETLLVLGAAGGVGLAAVELGKVMGARVIAAAGSAEKLAAAKATGADECINYQDGSLKDQVKALTDGRGADVIYDPVGGDLFDQSMRCINWGGRLLVVGFASGRIPQLPANLALLKGCSVVGVFWGEFRRRQPQDNRANFEDLFRWHAEGKLKPHISRTFPLEEAAQALTAMEQRSVVGKVVLTTG
jgi:NADPH2:quinone reductase